MRVIGVDLAWGRRGRTGLCAVQGGRVLDSTSVVTDDEIDAWIRARSADDVLVAIDAPIVVENPAGCRPCERVLGSVYGRHHAGPYPANRSMPAFRDGTRARALADRLGLDVNPAAADRSPVRLAIEVYPHTALVSLFELATTIKYKARSGRDHAARRRAFGDLLRYLRKLADLDPALDVVTSPRWSVLTGAVTDADSAAALERVEDELDAYVCAYVGRHHLRWRGSRSVTVGDAATGYIVTPAGAQHAAALRARARSHAVPVA